MVDGLSRFGIVVLFVEQAALERPWGRKMSHLKESPDVQIG